MTLQKKKSTQLIAGYWRQLIAISTGNSFAWKQVMVTHDTYTNFIGRMRLAVYSAIGFYLRVSYAVVSLETDYLASANLFRY